MSISERMTPITLDACYREMERMEREHAAEVEAFKDTIAIGRKRHAEQLRGAVSLAVLRDIARDMYDGMETGSPEQLAVSGFLGRAEEACGS